MKRKQDVQIVLDSGDISTVQVLEPKIEFNEYGFYISGYAFQNSEEREIVIKLRSCDGVSIINHEL